MMPKSQVVDRVARDELAESLRRFLSGRIDNLEFDDLDDLTLSDDPALFAIFYAVWPVYDDFRSHPLRLTEGKRLDFMRCIVFLHTDFEFEWQAPEGCVAWMVRRLMDGVTGRRLGLWPRPETGDLFCWPFHQRQDYALALARPRLLSGQDFSEGCRVAGRKHPKTGPSRMD